MNRGTKLIVALGAFYEHEKQRKKTLERIKGLFDSLDEEMQALTLQFADLLTEFQESIKEACE